tara:strand:+ start:440 stop:676 length:237 start_codon:yes stop_codon:yes gene_type:complete
MTENYSAFEGLNLSDARSKNETREEYKLRKKRNNQILKIYNKLGREQFQQMFPEGVNYKMFEQSTKEEVNGKQNKTTS